MSAVLDPPRRKHSAPPELAPPHDHLTVVWETTWQFYLQLDAKLEGSSSRVSYLKGRLDITTL